MKEKKIHTVRVDGQEIEVSREVYQVYQTGTRKEKYFTLDLKVKRTKVKKGGNEEIYLSSRECSLDEMLETGLQFTVPGLSVEETILQFIMKKKLHDCLNLLNEPERELIHAIYFEDKSQRELAKFYGLSQPAIKKRVDKILRKLKKYLEI